MIVCEVAFTDGLSLRSMQAQKGRSVSGEIRHDHFVRYKKRA